MKRADRVLASVLVSWAAVAAGCACPPYDGPARHVVFVSLDTTRADHFGFYGNDRVRTPRLDALAAESIVLDDFMTVVTTTLASHTSLFTGKYPHTHGVPRNGFVVNEDNVLLTELLRERGFTTAGFIGAFPLAERFGFAQGFDHWDEAFDTDKGGEYQQAERDASAVTNTIVDWLDERGVPEHLFLFAHYFDPHVPYAAPEPYDTMYDPRGRTDLPSWNEIQRDGWCRRSQRPEALERLALQYAGEISYLDHHVGRLLDALRDRGILDEALVVITSDHGEAFDEHASGVCFDHGWMNYQPTVRAVGLLRLPRAESAGLRIDGTLASIDLLAAVLDYLGIPHPAGVEGRSFDLTGDGEVPGGPRFCEATKPWEQVESDPRWRNLRKARSIRRGRHKLVQVPYLSYEELYDLEADPGETNNLLVAREPDVRNIARELRVALEAWTASAAPLPSEFLTDDPETLEKLKALGYVGN